MSSADRRTTTKTRREKRIKSVDDNRPTTTRVERARGSESKEEKRSERGEMKNERQWPKKGSGLDWRPKGVEGGRSCQVRRRTLVSVKETALNGTGSRASLICLLGCVHACRVSQEGGAPAGDSAWLLWYGRSGTENSTKAPSAAKYLSRGKTG